MSDWQSERRFPIDKTREVAFHVEHTFFRGVPVSLFTPFIVHMYFTFNHNTCTLEGTGVCVITDQPKESLSFSFDVVFGPVKKQ